MKAKLTVLGLRAGDSSALSVDRNKHIVLLKYQFEIQVKPLQNFCTKSIHTDRSHFVIAESERLTNRFISC